MPDDSDYAALGELLTRPETWTPEQEDFVRRLRDTQRSADESAHPLDKALRARLQRVIAELDQAISTREAWIADGGQDAE